MLSPQFLNITINLLLVIFAFICFFMIVLILLQKPKQEGLGASFGTSMTNEIFGAQTSNVLQKGTRNLAVAFFILAMLLTCLLGLKNKTRSLVSTEPAKKEAPAAVAPAPAKSLAEQLPAALPATESAPAPVVAPAVEDKSTKK